jgi:hypothetical protein
MSCSVRFCKGGEMSCSYTYVVSRQSRGLLDFNRFVLSLERNTGFYSSAHHAVGLHEEGRELIMTF